MLSEDAFIRIMDEDSPGSLENQIMDHQADFEDVLDNPDAYPGLERIDTPTGPMWKTATSQKLVIPPDNNIRREIMKVWHDSPPAGHPGRDETTRRVTQRYHWPGAKHWIAEYVRGCATCQQNKNITHRIRTPLYRIPSEPSARPFSHVAMDLITGLPPSKGFDAILTIVDHGATRGTIFLPCHTTTTGPQIAKLYLEHVYRWFGLPRKIISDRDP
jgi:hypothetical protein